MIDWFIIFQTLLPDALAWSLVIRKQLREFFDGLTGLPLDVQAYFDDTYDDLDPQKTRQLDLWEQQFALPDSGLTEQERRDRLDGAWKVLGGQSPRYIQDTLQNAGFDVYVHEWWEPIPGRPGGGSVNNDVTPVARNPFLYLNDSTFIGYTMSDGSETAQDGDVDAQDGGATSVTGYSLVNKGDGTIYTMPPDPATFPYYFYIGAETFPEKANVVPTRKDELEALILKIAPTEQWIGVLVTYA